MRQETLRFTSQKGKITRASKKWTSTRKETGRSNINVVNTITVQPHFDGPGIFAFGLTRKQASSHTVFGMTRIPACPKENKKKPTNSHLSKNINTILSPKKKKRSKKLK